MKLIIDIPEKVVTAIQNGEDYRYDIHTAIAQGKPCEERPKGKWIEIPVKRDLLYNTGIKYTCSICGSGNCYGKPPFCMYCGANMGVDNEGT